MQPSTKGGAFAGGPRRGRVLKCAEWCSGAPPRTAQLVPQVVIVGESPTLPVPDPVTVRSGGA